MQSIIDWFIKTTEDLRQFDTHIQGEVQKYSNKQCKKAFVVGAVFGVIIGGALATVIM